MDARSSLYTYTHTHTHIYIYVYIVRLSGKKTQVLSWHLRAWQSSHGVLKMMEIVTSIGFKVGFCFVFF